MNLSEQNMTDVTSTMSNTTETTETTETTKDANATTAQAWRNSSQIWSEGREIQYFSNVLNNLKKNNPL